MAEVVLAWLLYTLALLAWVVVGAGLEAPVADALRYADYVVAMNAHGVFGLTFGAVDIAPEPGRANAPLYLMAVAAISALDTGLYETLACRVAGGADCPLDIATLVAFNAALGGLAAAFAFVMARRLTGSRAVAWGSGALVLLAIGLLRSAGLLAPENGVLPAFFALSLALDKFARSKGWQAAFAAGAAIAIVTLVRPSYLYLLYGVVAGFVLLRHWRPSLAVIAGFAVVVAPWAIRNWLQFGDPALSGGQYGEIIIAQRLAYNAMTWGQWAVSFLYWLPEFGDQASAVLFDESLYAPLGLGPGTYFETAIADVYEPALARVGEGNVLRHLIETRVLGEPLKYAAVTVSLAWRGLFVAKTFGLVGLVCTLIVLVHTLRRNDWRFVLLLAPMVFMVGFHAAISISIERYNLFLALPYAIAIAWVVRESVRRRRA